MCYCLSVLFGCLAVCFQTNDRFLFVCLFLSFLCIVSLPDYTSKFILKQRSTQCQLLSAQIERIRTCLIFNFYASKSETIIWFGWWMLLACDPQTNHFIQHFWSMNGEWTITDTIFTIDLIHSFHLLLAYIYILFGSIDVNINWCCCHTW